MMQVSRGEKSGTVVAFSGQAGSAPTNGTTVPSGIPSQKRTLLEAFIASTGYVPEYARWLLNHAEEVQQTQGHSRLRTYGPEVQHPLFLAWHAANRICAKRLIPL
jgi:hypothetical protein